MKNSHRFARHALIAALPAALLAPAAVRADAVTDWNVKAGEFIAESKIGTPPAVRAMAIVQTAVRDAVAALAQAGSATSPVAVEAAVASANRAALAALLPLQQAGIEAAYKAALASLEEGAAKSGGIKSGETAAAAVLASRAGEAALFGAPDAQRPHAAAGVYVPTVLPAANVWSQRKPWTMSSASQFRPAPPPALASDAWARDFDEVKALGGRISKDRSAEQSDIARFWEYSLPAIYHGVVRSVALAPGRDAAANARLFATAAQAMDDALIGVFDAKYHYNLWRPVTAIRNGDLDGNDRTARDATWLSFIDTPMHPEYPSGHSILAGAVAAVLKAEVGPRASVKLSTSSPSAKGAVRSWTSFDDFVREVGVARIYGGMHFRSATEAGAAMGKQIGEQAAARAAAAAQ